MKKDPNFKVNLTTVKAVYPHPNPKVERLQICQIYGFETIVSKDKYKVGIEVIYIPINSVLPGKLENFLFPPDSKIKLEKARVKAAKIHGFVSQGMIVPWEDIKQLYNIEPNQFQLEDDLQEFLQITKYYPPKQIRVNNGAVLSKEPKLRNKTKTNPYFKEYGGCTNIKWCPNAFDENDEVWISPKLHGSNGRYGWMPYEPPTERPLNWYQKLFKTVKDWFKKPEVIIHPEIQWCYGSNKVQRQNKPESPTWYSTDVFSEITERYNLKEKLKEFPYHELIGEIIGPKIQKGYHYGLKNNETDFIVFDVLYQTKTESRWLGPDEAKQFTEKLGLKFIPILYKGKWDEKLAIELSQAKVSAFCQEQKIEEGVVVKNLNINSLQRKKIKIINPEYLMKESTGETEDAFAEDESDENEELV